MRKVLSVYTDGGVIEDGGGIGSRSRYGGTWAYCYVGENGKRIDAVSGYVLPGTYSDRYSLTNTTVISEDTVTNNITEFYAMLTAFENLPADYDHYAFFCDSKLTIGRFFSGWKCGGIPKELMNRFAIAYKRLAWHNPNTFSATFVKGHPNSYELTRGCTKKGSLVSIYNIWCDAQCRTLAQDYLTRRRKAQMQAGENGVMRNGIRKLNPEMEMQAK